MDGKQKSYSKEIILKRQRTNAWGVVILIYGLTFLFIGFHNYDIAVNLMILELEFNTSIVETNAIGMQMSLPVVYKLGIMMSFIGAFTLFIAGVYISSSWFNITKKDKQGSKYKPLRR